YELAHAGRTARYDAERLPGPRRDRFCVSATDTALGFRQAAVGGVHPAPVWRTSASRREALLLAGSRVGRFWTGVAMERASVLGDGLARSRRLEGDVDHARAQRGHHAVEPESRAAARVHARLKHRVGATLRHQPWTERRRVEWRTRDRSTLQTWLDELRQASAIRHIRCDCSP